MTIAKPRTIHWGPLASDDPVHGPQGKGTPVIPPGNPSGGLVASLWRTGPGIVGNELDGSCSVNYSAPEDDETIVILEGHAEITVTSTGKKYQLEAGSIMGHPRGLDVTWEIREPFLREFWVSWDSLDTASPTDDVHVGHVTDSDVRAPHAPVEPTMDSRYAANALRFVIPGRRGRSNANSGAGVGIPECERVDSSTIRYSALMCDEMVLLLEGRAHVVNEETGDEWHLRAGDVICSPHVLPVRRTSSPPFISSSGRSHMKPCRGVEAMSGSTVVDARAYAHDRRVAEARRRRSVGPVGAAGPNLGWAPPTACPRLRSNADDPLTHIGLIPRRPSDRRD